jgi:hypothetical protein
MDICTSGVSVARFEGLGTMTDTPDSRSAPKMTRLAPKSLTFALTMAVAPCSVHISGMSGSWAPGAMSLICTKLSEPNKTV